MRYCWWDYCLIIRLTSCVVSSCSDIVSLITSGPILALELQAENAVQRWRDLLGPTESAHARVSNPSSIRARYGTGVCVLQFVLLMLGMCGNRISVQFRFLKNRTEARRSNPKFRFPWLFSKPKLSHTNSQYLTLFMLWTQDSGMIGIM